MSRVPRTTVAAIGAFAVLGALLAPSAAVGADQQVTAATTVAVEGTVVVLSGREKVPGATTVELLPDSVRLLTPDGTTIELSGDLVDSVATGSEFTGTVSIPAEAVADINEAVAVTVPDETAEQGQTVEATSELAQGILAASETLDVPLVVESATIEEPPTASAAPATAHTLDIAVVALPSAPGDPALSDGGAATLTSTLSTYWNSQTNGQIASIGKNATISRFTSTSACDPSAIWEEAAAKFSSTTYSYWASASARHLVVIAPASCRTAGLGSVGTLHAGGLTFAAYSTLLGTATVAHELGHNLGLHHSNVHECPLPVIEGTASGDGFTDGCFDDEYGDYFDIMGGGLTIGGGSNGDFSNSQLMALNVTHKSLIGGLPTSDLTSITLPPSSGISTTAVALSAASATSGVRGVAVTDPRTGEDYFIEYRSGTGIDSGSIYASGVIDEYRPGVRVMRLRPDGTSAVLTEATGERALSLLTGGSITSRSGGISVTVSSIASVATVSVVLRGASDMAVNRISGTDRYSTAVAISKEAFPGTAPTVYIATGTDYPDALGAAPAATKAGGPLLLTDPSGLPDSVSKEIARLKPSTIKIVGGTAAVSEKVRSALATLRPTATVTRIAGTDRFDTARKVVTDAFGPSVGAAYIATGRNYPDALSASAAAGAAGIPVILVEGGAGSLDTSTRDMIVSLGITRATLVGGTSAVSAGVEASIRTVPRVGTVERLSGTDRFNTSRRINAAAFGSATPQQVYFATGYQFPDALAGAALAGSRGAPLYVVPSTCVTGDVLDDLASYGTDRATLLGGESALGTGVFALARC